MVVVVLGVVVGHEEVRGEVRAVGLEVVRHLDHQVQDPVLRPLVGDVVHVERCDLLRQGLGPRQAALETRGLGAELAQAEHAEGQGQGAAEGDVEGEEHALPLRGDLGGLGRVADQPEGDLQNGEQHDGADHQRMDQGSVRQGAAADHAEVGRHKPHGDDPHRVHVASEGPVPGQAGAEGPIHHKEARWANPMRELPIHNTDTADAKGDENQHRGVCGVQHVPKGCQDR